MSMAFPEVLPARTDGAGRIAVDFPCGRCGYNLRAQRPGSACPECGSAIDAADDDEPLAGADGGYVRGVERGARRLGWGVALMMPLVYPGLFVVAAGVWGVTRKEPGRRERWSERNGRMLARWMVGLGTPAALGAAAWAGWEVVWGRGMGGREATWRLIDSVLTGTHAAVFLGCMFAWRHLFDLAARADGLDAARTLRRLWRRYFQALLFIAGVGLAVNAYGALNAERWVGSAWVRQALPALVLLLVASVGVALWWQTLKATRALAGVISRVDAGGRAPGPGLVPELVPGPGPGVGPGRDPRGGRIGAASGGRNASR